LCETLAVAEDSASKDFSSAYKLISKKIKSKNFVINSVIEQHDRQLLLIEAPQVEASELTDAARWKIKDMIDFSIDDAVIDVIEIPNIKELKRSPMLYAVVVKREVITSIVEFWNSIGNDLSIIDIPDMAQRNIAALLNEDQNGVAVLSINANNSLLTITRRGELYLSRELETGFEHLLATVQAQNSSLEPNSVDMLKALERMVLEVQRSLDYYESQYSQPQINALYLAPFAYDIPEIKDYFSSQLGIKTRMLDFNRLFSTNEPISYQLQADAFKSIGAALR
jgi:MSHA biogenesis protein MshI